MLLDTHGLNTKNDIPCLLRIWRAIISWHAIRRYLKEMTECTESSNLGTACSAKHIKILVAAFFRCIISKGSTDVATHIEVYLLFNTSVRESEIQ